MSSAGEFESKTEPTSEPLTDLDQAFAAACEKCKRSRECAEASNEDKLRLYGLYKQVCPQV